MKHCTLPTLLAVKTTILPTVPAKNSETGKSVYFLLCTNTKHWPNRKLIDYCVTLILMEDDNF